MPANRDSIASDASFWERIHKIRTNSFQFEDSLPESLASGNSCCPNRPRTRYWAIRSRKSHILDTTGHFGWKRELSCFQGQSLPDAIFPDNTIEITTHTESKNAYRIRFGALEALRGWMALDSDPIPTTHARDSDHWKRIGMHIPLEDETTISATSYDYTYTTPYKGGTDRINNITHRNNDDEVTQNLYRYLKPNSTSFVAKHNANSYDLPSKKNTGNVKRVKLRKPICKCKGDGGRAPFVSEITNSATGGMKETKSKKTTLDSIETSKQSILDLPPPVWKVTDQHRVDIEGMLQRASMMNPQKPFQFREDVDLWEDDLHDNGTAWLKVRTFVCREGWACLLRNFVRVDGVICRVLDTRYIHRFGENRIYREHSWREGSWQELLNRIQESSDCPTGSLSTSRQQPTQRTTTSTTSLESINDSIAARYLPLKRTPVTEYLSLEDERNKFENITSFGRERLILLHDATIDDAIPIRTPMNNAFHGISFLLKRNNGRRLEAISSRAIEHGSSLSTCLESVWKKAYSKDQSSNILSLSISPDGSDGGKVAMGDDSGWVQVWRLSTGDCLWRFPVASKMVRDRRVRHPLFQSERLWVQHLVWSNEGRYVGAAAGRNSIISQEGIVTGTMESTTGTVTGLAFRNCGGNEQTLAVASYGQVQSLTVPSASSANENTTISQFPTLERTGAAVECIAVAPDGQKIAVGFLDKTLRVYEMTDGNPEDESTPQVPGCVDWVGFNAAVKAVQFHASGNWLAAMGGTSILVIGKNLDSRREAPIVCRTPGVMNSDGDDGTCHRFSRIEWSCNEKDTHAFLAALDAKDGNIHVFSFAKLSNSKATSRSDDAWPRQTFPIRIISPSFLRPWQFFNRTTFAFFKTIGVTMTETKNVIESATLDVHLSPGDEMKDKIGIGHLNRDENFGTRQSTGTGPTESAHIESFALRVIHQGA